VNGCRNIHWADDAPRDWIESIRSVDTIVELGLSEFGAPDLMFLCRTDEPTPVLIFLEAKAVCYSVSAQSNEKGIITRGFNSSINGQLTLKYRFAHALQQWDGNPDRIEEPLDLHDAYTTEPEFGGLGDPKATPRHLGKHRILKTLSDLNLNGHPVNRCFFVAWTWDQESPFGDNNGLPSEFGPLLLDADTGEVWPDWRSHVGWIGYQPFDENTELGEVLGTEFSEAVRMMRPNAPGQIPQWFQEGDVRRLKTFNVSQFNHLTKQQLDQLEELARDRLGSRSVIRRSGSTSIMVRGKVHVKLVPQHEPRECVWIGVSTSLGFQHWSELTFEENDVWRIGVGNRAQDFYFRELPDGAHGAQILGEVCDEIAERLEFDLEID